MSYAEDYDDYEQDYQGQEFQSKQTDYDQMIESFGYSDSEFANLSRNQQQRIEWNWKYVQTKR